MTSDGFSENGYNFNLAGSARNDDCRSFISHWAAYITKKPCQRLTYADTCSQAVVIAARKWRRGKVRRQTDANRDTVPCRYGSGDTAKRRLYTQPASQPAGPDRSLCVARRDVPLCRYTRGLVQNPDPGRTERPAVVWW